MGTSSASPGPSSGERQPIWSRPGRGSRGPSPAHSRATIVATAVGLADADGLDAVSMRAVAAALGTGAGTLYRYLSSRDDLLDLMIDAVVAELRLYDPPADGWLDTMLAMGRDQLALFRRHRWLLDLTPRTSGVGPESLAWFDACLRVLEPVAAPPGAKLEAVALMTGVVTLVARSTDAPQPSPFAGHDLRAYPHLQSALTQPAGPPPEQDLFERALRVLLPGLLGGVPPGVED